jgi:hypothetical protein
MNQKLKIKYLMIKLSSGKTFLKKIAVIALKSRKIYKKLQEWEWQAWLCQGLALLH